MQPQRKVADKSEEPISAEQAAALIFGTNAPTMAQVGGVRDMMRRGELRQSAKRHFTTTRNAVADYLADRELRKAERSLKRSLATDGQANGIKSRKHEKAIGGGQSPRHIAPAAVAGKHRHLRGMYRDLLRDYFLSVVVYGRSRDRSAEYQRRVLIGRCIVVVLLGALIGWTFYNMVSGTPNAPEWAEAGAVRARQENSPEKQVVLAFLRKYRTGAVLMDILPARQRPGGKAIRVRYRHQLTDKRTGKVSHPIEDVVFVVNGNEILRDEPPGDQDRALEATLTGKPAPQDPRKRPPVDGLLPPPPPPKN